MVFASASVIGVEQAPQNGCCQRLCLQGESQLRAASLGGSPRSANMSDTGSFQTTASALVSEYVRFCVHPLKAESLFPTALWLS